MVSFTTITVTIVAVLSMTQPGQGHFVKTLFTGKRSLPYSHDIVARNMDLVQGLQGCSTGKETIKVSMGKANQFIVKSGDGSFDPKCEDEATKYIADKKNPDGVLTKVNAGEYHMVPNAAHLAEWKAALAKMGGGAKAAGEDTPKGTKPAVKSATGTKAATGAKKGGAAPKVRREVQW